MLNVVLTIHVLIVLALLGVVLLQRSDGSALGIGGGGGGGGGFMTGAGAADALTRTTSILAALFFATSLGLAIFAQPVESQNDLIEDLTGTSIRDPNEPTTAEDLLRTLGGDTEGVDTEDDGDNGSDATGVQAEQRSAASDDASDGDETGDESPPAERP